MYFFRHVNTNKNNHSTPSVFYLYIINNNIYYLFEILFVYKFTNINTNIQYLLTFKGFQIR